jgi:hypothetical protein
MLDVGGAPIGVQQKLMRHAQLSTTMRYGNAYMTEERKATGAVVHEILPADAARNEMWRLQALICLALSCVGFSSTSYQNQYAYFDSETCGTVAEARK